MSHLPSEQTLETVRMLGTLKCVARYDFVADDGEVYYISDYEFGEGKHLHVCLLNVPDSYFRIAPLRYLTVQPRSSWYVNDTKIDTESEIGPQLAESMREWLNSNPWKEFTSFDSATGRRLYYGVDKIKRYACCGCAVGSHKKNPEELEDHKDSPVGAMPAEPHPSNGEDGEAGFAASVDQAGGESEPDNSTEKGKEIPQSPKSPLHNGIPTAAVEQSSQQAACGTNTESTNVNGGSGFSPATMAYQAKQDRRRICNIIDTSLKDRGYFASPDIIETAYDAGFRTCTEAEGFGEWCKLWNIPRNLPEGPSDTKEARQPVHGAPHGSVPQGMMMINMDLVPLELRDFVAQWCKAVSATTANGAAPATSESFSEGPPSTATGNQSNTAQKRAFHDAFDHDTTSNKKRVRSCGEMSLWQSCYTQPAHPVQPYGTATSETAPVDETSSSSNQHAQAEKRAKRTPSSAANKSNDAVNTSKPKAVQGVKRKNEDDHDGFRNFVAPKPEFSTTSNEQSGSNEKRVLRTPSSPATKSSSSSRASSPDKSDNAGSPSGSQEPRSLKRKNSNEHPKVLHGQIIDIVEEDEVEEANIKASPDVLKTRKIAHPSSDLDRI